MRNRLGLRWILIALANKGSDEEDGDLEKVFELLFQNHDYMLLYDKSYSIMHKH